MKKVQLSVDGISTTVLTLGFEGEQNHTQIVIYWTALYEQYPSATATMVIKPPTGDAYPKVITQSGTRILWDVSAADTSIPGNGSYQLTFTNGDEIIKTFIGSYRVLNSITGSGEAPDPVTDWVNEANEVLASIPNTINEAVDNALEEAKESGDFKGDPGEPGAKGDKGDPGDPAPAEEVAGAVDAYLAENFSNPSNPPLDRSLTSALSAAPADMVGDLKNDFDDLSEAITTYLPDTNNNLASGKTLIQGYYGNLGAFNNNSKYSHLLIDVSNVSRIYIDGSLGTYTSTEFNSLGIFSDSNDEFMTSILAITGASPTFPISIDIPDGAYTLKLNTDYKSSDYPSSLPEGLVVYPYVTNKRVKKLKFIAGVIRNSGNGWEYINDAGHEPLNLTSISVDANGRIEIDYGFTASKVLSLIATPDETFANKYTIGGSVGLDKTLFNVYSAPINYGGQVTVSENSVTVTYSNFTSGSFDTSTGELRLYHPSISSIPTKEKFNVSAICKSISNNVVDVRTGSQGNDYISLYLLDSSGDIIKDTTNSTITLTATRQINSVLIDANNIVSASGNFWIYGVMEI